MSRKPVVAVAMSGGVDSSVAAALLIEQGYSVIGMMLRLWSLQESGQGNRCCSPDSMALARRVAATLSIPFYVLDARQIFFDHVVTPFIHDYAHNLTPNPCIACNRLVRWGFLLNHALAAGAEYLATGHYARIVRQPDSPAQLLRGVDSNKDQSYVLHVLTQAQLGHAMFPLGEHTKPEVRGLARKFNLPVAERPDSQDLCFIGTGGDYRRFLAEQSPETIIPGRITNEEGTVLGYHQGLPFYTIGQRKGLGIASPAPLYVINKDEATNTLVVGQHAQALRDTCVATHMNWISGEMPSALFDATVKIRYKAKDMPATIIPIESGDIRISFKNPVSDITPGQAAVIYNGEACLGGGIISS